MFVHRVEGPFAHRLDIGVVLASGLVLGTGLVLGMDIGVVLASGLVLGTDDCFTESSPRGLNLSAFGFQLGSGSRFE